MIEQINLGGAQLFGPTLWLVIWSLIKIIAVVLPLMGCVAYLTLWERKAIGWTQIRPGPNRVGPWGLLTPIADAVKLVFKPTDGGPPLPMGSAGRCGKARAHSSARRAPACPAASGSASPSRA